MKPPTQRDLQAENRRTQLLDLALALFAEHGVENVSIKDLAREAHIAQGLIYYYFESKDALVLGVFRRHNPFPAVQEIIRSISGQPIEEGLLQFTGELARLMTEKRSVFRLMLRELISPRTVLWDQARAAQGETVLLMTRYFQERIDAGELKPQLPVIPIQMLISSFLINLFVEQPLDQLGPQLVKVLLDGIRAA